LILFENRIFAGVIKIKIKTGPYSVRVGPRSTGFLKDEKDREIQKEESYIGRDSPEKKNQQINKCILYMCVIYTCVYEEICSCVCRG
jgi:hypothetical protein